MNGENSFFLRCESVGELERENSSGTYREFTVKAWPPLMEEGDKRRNRVSLELVD